MPAKFRLHSKLFRPAQVGEITGIAPGAQRDLQRRGYRFGNETDGWLNASVHDIARLLLVKTLRDAGIELAEAWKKAGPEIVGNIVYYALREPHAIDLRTDAKAALERNKSIILRWAMDFAASETQDGKHVGGGDYFIFGPTLPSNQYASIEDAISEGERESKGPHLVMHVVALRELSKLLVERAGQIAYVEKVA